jgi:hypothetical protein
MLHCCPYLCTLELLKINAPGIAIASENEVSSCLSSHREQPSQRLRSRKSTILALQQAVALLDDHCSQKRAGQ